MTNSPPSAGSDSSGKWLKIILATIPVLGVLGAAYISGVFSHSSSAAQSSGTPVAAPPSVTASSSAVPVSPSTSPSPSDLAPTATGNGTDSASPQPGLQYLSDLGPIGGLGNYERTGPADLLGKTYGNSVVFAPSQFNPGRKTLTYNIPSGMQHFRATVGLDDKTLDGAVVFFQIERGQTPVDAGFTLHVGEEKQIDLNIAGTQHLTIEVEATARPSGSVNAPLHAVWGDARFSVD